MALTTDTTIGGGLGSRDKLTLRRFWVSDLSAVSKRRFGMSRSHKKLLPSYSLLDQVSSAWSLLSDEIKAAWQTAGSYSGIGGYPAFVQDKSYRIKNEIIGNASPSNYHQYLIGHLSIGEGAGDVHLKQTGSGGLVFPASLKISRQTSLTADPSNGEFIKVRFKYSYNEGGGDQEQVDELSLDLSSAWSVETLPLTPHTGLLGPWSMEIECHSLKGDFYFDNFYCTSSGGIFTNDPRCVVVEKRWQMVKFPAGVTLASVYPQGGAL